MQIKPINNTISMIGVGKTQTWTASFAAVLVHRASLSCLWRTLATTPQISSASSNCSPIKAIICSMNERSSLITQTQSKWSSLTNRKNSKGTENRKIFTVSNHIVSRFSFLLQLTVHFPPLAHSGSSHLGSTPALNKWKSALPVNLLGLIIWSYRLQKTIFPWHCNLYIEDDTKPFNISWNFNRTLTSSRK